MYNLSYSGTLYVESHADILDYCAQSGVQVDELNRCIRLEPTVTDCRGIFANLKSFNKSVVFPNSVEDASLAFAGCDSFTQYVFIDHKLYELMQRSPRKLGLADSYPTNRIIVTNNNKSFDLYLGDCAQFPPSIPGIIQLLKTDSPRDQVDCNMFFRSIPELRFTIKTVYIYITSYDMFISVSKKLDAALTVNPDMFADTSYHIYVNRSMNFVPDSYKISYEYLNRATVYIV